MRNEDSTFRDYKNDNYCKRFEVEMQRKIIDLQFQRIELEEQLMRVNEVLFSLCREM